MANIGRRISFLIWWQGRTIRVWAQKERGSQRVMFDAQYVGGMTGELHRKLIRRIREAALVSYPLVMDHDHEPSGDGIDLDVNLPSDSVRTTLPFVVSEPSARPSFGSVWGQGLKEAGFYPEDCRVEDVNEKGVRFGQLIQDKVDLHV